MESRIQGSRPKAKDTKNPRPRTAIPRTDPLEAKDRNARGQGQGSRTQVQVFSKKKIFKKISQAFFGKKKRKDLQNNFSGEVQNFNPSKNSVLSSSRGQGNFRGLEASRPRPRTSKCVLEDFTSGYNVSKVF